jgi:CRP-like cAMP-binding protein
VFALTSWQFTPLLEQHPQIAIKVAKLLARRLRESEERQAANQSST